MAQYNDPQYTDPKQYGPVLTSVTNAAGSKFALANAAILRKAVAVVVTAGTNVGIGGVGNGADGYSVVFGTTTAGVIVTGSDTAGAFIGNFTLTGTVPAGTPIRLLHGTETTGVFNVSVEYVNQYS